MVCTPPKPNSKTPWRCTPHCNPIYQMEPTSSLSKIREIIRNVYFHGNWTWSSSLHVKFLRGFTTTKKIGKSFLIDVAIGRPRSTLATNSKTHSHVFQMLQMSQLKLKTFNLVLSSLGSTLGIDIPIYVLVQAAVKLDALTGSRTYCTLRLCVPSMGLRLPSFVQFQLVWAVWLGQ